MKRVAANDVAAGDDLPFYGSELRQRAGYLLRRTHRLHGQLWASMATREMTPSQFSVLSLIERNPRIDQRTLGDQAFLDRASVTSVVSRLVQRDVVRRARDPQDRRRWLLTLNPDRREEVVSVRGMAETIWSEMFAPVPASERAGFIRGLESIAGYSPDEPDAGRLFRRLDQRRTAAWTELVGRTLTGAQYAVMYVVRRRPGVSQAELDDIAAVDRSTAADIIERLEARGWVVRSSDPADARVRRVSPTVEALERLDRLEWPIAEVQRRLLAPVPAHRQAQFMGNWALVAYRGDPPTGL